MASLCSLDPSLDDLEVHPRCEHKESIRLVFGSIRPPLLGNTFSRGPVPLRKVRASNDQIPANSQAGSRQRYGVRPACQSRWLSE